MLDVTKQFCNDICLFVYCKTNVYAAHFQRAFRHTLTGQMTGLTALQLAKRGMSNTISDDGFRPRQRRPGTTGGGLGRSSVAISSCYKLAGLHDGAKVDALPSSPDTLGTSWVR